MNPENNTPKYVDTPRWGAVEISEVFNDPLQAAIAGYTESTGRPDVKGKHIESKIDENGHGWSKFVWCQVVA